MLRGRHGVGWMVVAWFLLAALAITVAFVLGPQLARVLFAGQGEIIPAETPRPDPLAFLAPDISEL
jgi:hypothetical protein